MKKFKTARQMALFDIKEYIDNNYTIDEKLYIVSSMYLCNSKTIQRKNKKLGVNKVNYIENENGKRKLQHNKNQSKI